MMISKLFLRFKEFFSSHPRITLFTKISLWCILFLCILYTVVFFIIYSSIPSRSELRNIQNHTASEVYSSDGVLLGKYYIQDRTNISYNKISPHVVKALIATEDVRFYKHDGVDTRGLFRVFFKTLLLQDEASGGGSTITQQLAKNLFPRKKYPIFSLPLNKLREIILARKFEDVLTKEEILTLYLNSVPFGENAYGIASASKRFFNTSPDSLKLEEAAVLIGMLKATTAYNPKKNLKRSFERRNVVLGQMVKYKFVSAEMVDSLKKLPVNLRYNYSTHTEGLATYFREHLRIEVQRWLEQNKKKDGTSYNLYTDGLKIYTTINSKMQKYAEESVTEHMSLLQKSFYAHWGKRAPWGKNNDVIEKAKQRSERYITLKEMGLSEKEINENFNTPVTMKIFTYKGEETKTMSPLDSIKYYLRFLQPGFLVLENGTGQVRAWVGGIDYRFFKYDHVNINTKRQVGSTFKPIVYAAALQKGIKPCEYIPNEQVVNVEYDNWSPHNSDNTYGGMYSMQGGLTNSVNTISANIIMQAGIDNVIKLAKQMGINSPLDPVPSLALGTADVSLYEMAGAFSVFANRGNYVKPIYLEKILDNKGNLVKDFTSNREEQRVLSKNNADMMIQMLKNVVNNGTAGRLRYKYGLEGDMAGKTGTTQSHADGWFIGFTPKLVAAAWVGAEDRRIHFRSLDLGQGASTALPIWGSFMKKIYKDPEFKSYKTATFKLPSEEALAQMSCVDYIPPDTLNDSWWWPFGKNDDKDSIQVQKTIQRENKRQRKEQERAENSGAFDKLRKFFGKNKR